MQTAMKQVTITTGKCTLLVVELPKDAAHFNTMGIGAEDTDTSIHYNNGTCSHIGYNLISLGAYPSIIEEQAKEVVDSKHIESSCNCDECGFDYHAYRNYLEQDDKHWDNHPSADCASTALESLDSLMEANEVHFENPLGEHPCESIRETGVASTYCYDYCQGLCSGDVDFEFQS